MRQFFLMFFCACVCLVNVPAGALTITKAETVAPTETSSDANATSLIPTVLGLISNVQQLNQKQKLLQQFHNIILKQSKVVSLKFYVEF